MTSFDEEMRKGGRGNWNEKAWNKIGAKHYEKFIGNTKSSKFASQLNYSSAWVTKDTFCIQLLLAQCPGTLCHPRFVCHSSASSWAWVPLNFSTSLECQKIFPACWAISPWGQGKKIIGALPPRGGIKSADEEETELPPLTPTSGALPVTPVLNRRYSENLSSAFQRWSCWLGSF